MKAGYRCLIGLLILLVMGGSVLLAADNSQNEPEEELAYRTIRGSIYDLGTGTMSMLIFSPGGEGELLSGGNFLLEGDEKKLRKLIGLPVVLTGAVDPECDKTLSKMKVENFNLDYELTEEEQDVQVYGTLKEFQEQFYLLTPDQIVVKLENVSYQALQDFIGQEMLFSGQAVLEDEFQATMAVSSYNNLE